MKTLGANLLASSQKVNKTSPFVWLVEAIADTTIANRVLFRLANVPEIITFVGTDYYPGSLQVESIVSDGQGNLPSLNLTVRDVLQEMRGYLNTGDGFMGSQVTLTLVDRDHLASAADSLSFSFYVAGAAENAMGITFRLAERNWWDYEVPQEIVYRGRCPLIFKGDICQYRGPESECNKLLATCIEFGNLEVQRGYPRMHPRQFGAEPAIPLLMR